MNVDPCLRQNPARRLVHQLPKRLAGCRWKTWLAVVVLLTSSWGSAQETPDTTADRPHLEVFGVVTDPDGNPVANARMYLPIGRLTSARVLTTESDANGSWSFKLDEEPKSDLVVLVEKAGFAIGLGEKDYHPFYNDVDQIRLGTNVELLIQLKKASPLNLQVVDEQGKPVADARLGLMAMSLANGSSTFYWGKPLVPALAWTTGSDGRVTIDSLLASHSVSLQIETKDHGAQYVLIDPAKVETDAVISLLPCCRMEIALTAPEASEIKGRELEIESHFANDAKEEPKKSKALRPWGGKAQAETDASGKATVILPAGGTHISVRSRAQHHHFAEATTSTSSKPGQTVAVKIPLTPGTKVRGRVQTPEGGPVAGVGIRSTGGETRSDDDGRFEVWAPLTQAIQIHVMDIPEGYTIPFEPDIYLAVTDEDKKSSVRERELPPIILRKAASVAGRILDESGNPVSRARVIANWVQQHESAGYFTLKTDVTTSDEAGRFRFRRVFPNVDAIVAAQTNERCVVEASTINTTNPHELTLTVTPDGMIPIVGSAKGTDGQGLSDVSIRVTRGLVGPGGHNYGSRPVEWLGQKDFPGKLDGSFHSPGLVPRFNQYSLTVAAPGYLAVETPFTSAPSTGKMLDLGEIKLAKARIISGIVADSSGSPVAGAAVWTWAASADGGRSYAERTTATTDESGRFKLEKVHPAAALAFASKPEWRLSGCALPKNDPEVSIVLFRTDEELPAERALKPHEPDRARQSAAVRKMLDAVLADKRNSNYFHREILTMLFKAHPESARAELLQTSSADTRARALASLGEIDDAIAEAESIQDAYSRAYCRFAMIDSVRDADQVRDMLAAAFLDAQSIVQPDHRVVIIANIVERFSKAGDMDRAATILRDELPRAEALSTKEWPGFARGYFAAQLARVEPNIALRLASEAGPDDQTRHYQNIAHVLAAIKPELAEEAIRRIKGHRYVDDPAIRVAYRMATVDLDRAIRLVESVDDQQRPAEKARGLGVIAWALRDKDPKQARELLSRAFASLPDQHGGAGSRSDDIFGAAMFLLGFAESIDPDRLTEYFWTTASKHPGPSGGAWTPDDAPRSDAERQSRLAILVSRYHAAPGLPEEMIEPAFEFWERQLGTNSSHFTDHEGTFIAMALIQPDRAGEWAVRFNEKLDPERRRYIPQPWEVIGNAMTMDRRALSDYITRQVFHRWVIDQYD